MNSTLNSHQTNGPAARHDYLKWAVPVFFLLIILFFSAWVRFDGITEQGITGGDSFRYIREAKLWVDGEPPKFGGPFYRPISYFLHSTALRILGYNDYSIKILHVLMDMLNILLIFVIAGKLAKNLWVGVISSLLYVFLPTVVYLTRHEMVHVETTTFVLLAFFFFMLFDRQEQKGFKVYLFLFLSGLSSGLAANTHADMAILGPVYVLYLFIKSYNRQNIKKSFLDFFVFAFIFTFSFFVPYFVGFLVFGVNTVINKMLAEIEIVNYTFAHYYDAPPKLLFFFVILKKSIEYYFRNHFFIISIMLIGVIVIMVYRKIKKESDPLLAYLPLMLILLYEFIYIWFLKSDESCGRYFMPLFPMLIFTLTLWYYKIARQLLGKYFLVGFIGLFLILFILNPKVMPGKVRFKSPYRSVHDYLEDEVNPENKLLLAPVTLYSMDRGYQSDLYFGKDAIYMFELPLDKEYNLQSLKELLADRNIRYIFLGRRIDKRLLIPNHPLRFINRYKHWLANDKSPYSLEKDLEIIHAYIRDKGGLLINKNRHGEIYYLGDEKPLPKQSGLVSNGSFEYWWKGLPSGGWILHSGRIYRSREATEGTSSICFEPGHKKGGRLIRHLGDWHKDEVKLRVRLDVKAGKPGEFCFFFSATLDEKRLIIKPGKAVYTGNGDWLTMVNDFILTPGMKGILFHLRLLPGTRKPAYVDNLSIERLKEQ